MRLRVEQLLLGNTATQFTKELRKSLKTHGIPYDSSKTSQQISKDDFEYFDYIIGMDESNLLDLTRMCPKKQQHKIEAFASESVPDPWYTGDFNETYDRVFSWLPSMAITFRK